jgi:hypothetical protein
LPTIPKITLKSARKLNGEKRKMFGKLTVSGFQYRVDWMSSGFEKLRKRYLPFIKHETGNPKL